MNTYSHWCHWDLSSPNHFSCFRTWPTGNIQRIGFRVCLSHMNNTTGGCFTDLTPLPRSRDHVDSTPTLSSARVTTNSLDIGVFYVGVTAFSQGDICFLLVCFLFCFYVCQVLEVSLTSPTLSGGIKQGIPCCVHTSISPGFQRTLY